MATRARKYSPSAGKDVEREMRKYKRGTLKSGRGGKGGTVKNPRQAIAIGLSEARREGKKVPPRAASKRGGKSRTRSASKTRRTRRK